MEYKLSGNSGYKKGGVNMKKLIYVSLLILLAMTLFGCDSPPKPPPVVVPEGVICEGGNYKVYYGEWTMTGCEGDEQVKGTYWENLNGRMFLLGDPVKWNPNGTMQADIIKVYGKCPASYIKEIEMKKAYLEEVGKGIK